MKQPVPRKHIPTRTCIACRESGPKRGLVRIVRTPAGAVEVDLTGKKAGRGAYLCRRRSCWDIGLKKSRIEHALQTTITSQDREDLAEFGKSLSEAFEMSD